jgi:FixJ family two-component response regulator
MQSTGTVVYIVSSDLTKEQNLTELIRSHGVDVVSYDSAAAYTRAKRADQMACLIVDLNLSDISGLEFQRSLAHTGAPPVIFVTAHGDLASCVRAVKDGAIDVLLEPVDPAELFASVELAFARDQRSRRERLERVSLLTRWRTLTPRETEVFHHTVAGLLNKQAAAELGVAENTYQVHRGRVMRKMHANSLADLVRMSMKLKSIRKEGREVKTQAPVAHISPTAQVHKKPMLRRTTFHGDLNTRFGAFAPSGRFWAISKSGEVAIEGWN